MLISMNIIIEILLTNSVQFFHRAYNVRSMSEHWEDQEINIQ